MMNETTTLLIGLLTEDCYGERDGAMVDFVTGRRLLMLHRSKTLAIIYVDNIVHLY